MIVVSMLMYNNLSIVAFSDCHLSERLCVTRAPVRTMNTELILPRIFISLKFVKVLINHLYTL